MAPSHWTPFFLWLMEKPTPYIDVPTQPLQPGALPQQVVEKLSQETMEAKEYLGFSPQYHTVFGVETPHWIFRSFHSTS
jgi:hypothetical protein